MSSKIWLEANTERSESNPGRSLGYLESKGELSGRQYPIRCAHSPLARSPRSKSITDNADATDLFFHGFLLCLAGFSAPAGRNDCHGLFLAEGLIDLIAVNFYKQQNH